MSRLGRGMSFKICSLEHLTFLKQVFNAFEDVLALSSCTESCRKTLLLGQLV